MDEPIDQRTIARNLGISQPWVSLALRGSSRVPLATRLRIQAEAERLGYRPDPLQAALGQQRRGRCVRPPLIAWVGVRGEHYLVAAVARAAALGYELIHLPSMDPAELATRRVVGVLVQQDLPGRVPALSLPAVQVGLGSQVSRIAVVRPDLAAAVRLCLDHLRRLGHVRIQVVQFRQPRSLSGDLVEDAVAGQALRHGDVTYARALWRADQRRLPVDCVDADAYVVNSSILAEHLHAAGRPVVLLCASAPGVSGCDLRYDQVAQVAVDVLDGRIRRGALCVAEVEHVICIPPSWVSA